MTKTPEKLIDAAAAAELLAVSKRTVWEWSAQGRLPCVRLNTRTVRYRPSDLAEWMENRTQDGES